MKMSDLLGFLENPNDFDVLYRGEKVTYLDEVGAPNENSKFFAAGFEFGPSTIVHVESYRGDGFETAYAAWIDSMPEIEKGEYVEAYKPANGDKSFEEMARAEFDEAEPNWGCPSYASSKWEERRAWIERRARELLDEAVDAAHDGNGDYPELIEGYHEDSRGRVKSIGHYECFFEADLDEIKLVPREK